MEFIKITYDATKQFEMQFTGNEQTRILIYID